MCLCLCEYTGHLCRHARGQKIWRWVCEPLWAARWGCCEPNLEPPKEAYSHLLSHPIGIPTPHTSKTYLFSFFGALIFILHVLMQTWSWRILSTTTITKILFKNLNVVALIFRLKTDYSSVGPGVHTPLWLQCLGIWRCLLVFMATTCHGLLTYMQAKHPFT